MPRLARLDAPGVLHQVMGRGSKKWKIFFGDRDRVDLISGLGGCRRPMILEVARYLGVTNSCITRAIGAAFPPQSPEQDYIRYLKAAARYFVGGDVLHIDLKSDTGTMKFTR